jgi:hypothetical protein
MSTKEKGLIMIGAAQLNNNINENILAVTKQQPQTNNSTTSTAKTRTGSFVGAGDGFHNAEGIAKVIPLENGDSILRLEAFKSTNAPNVHVYLSADKTISDYVDLGRLKANNGNQNYNIPSGTNLKKYNTVLIWCKDFSVLIGSAQLKIT